MLKISTLVLKPFYISPSFAYRECHNPVSCMHVSLLPSLKQQLSEMTSDDDVINVFSRLEWNPVSRKMAYCVYLVQKSPVYDEFVHRLKEEPWHDRWPEYRQQPWVRSALEWISAKEAPDRGLRLSCPTMLLSVHPMVRACWWIEDKLRALLGVQTIDISSDYHPMLYGCCLSVIVPSYVEWPADWTMDLARLQDQ